MTRSNYTDDNEYAGLYRGNVERSLRSKAGQARLRELRDALEAKPIRELEAETFLKPTGEACALGQWAATHLPDARQPIHFDGNDEDTADLLKPFGWPKLVVWETVYINDDTYYVKGPEMEGPHRAAYMYHGMRWPVVYHRTETPAERYTRVLAWVKDQILP